MVRKELRKALSRASERPSRVLGLHKTMVAQLETETRGKGGLWAEGSGGLVYSHMAAQRDLLIVVFEHG